MAVSKATFSFRDSQGRTARSTVNLIVTAASATQNLQLVADTVLSGMQGLSNAHATWNGDTPAVPTYGGTGDYISSQDKAVFLFFTANGAPHRIQIPAPLESIFLADKITIDKTNAAVVTFLADASTYICNANGQAFTDFVGGFFQRRKLPRRVGSLVLSPKGDTPAQ